MPVFGGNSALLFPLVSLVAVNILLHCHLSLNLFTSSFLYLELLFGQWGSIISSLKNRLELLEKFGWVPEALILDFGATLRYVGLVACHQVKQ